MSGAAPSRIGAAVALCAVTQIALADGGSVQFQRRTGALLVTLFTSPVPLHVGSADLSVLVQRVEDRSEVLNCGVMLWLSKAGESDIEVAATHEQATDKLLYAARVAVPVAGMWHVHAAIKAGADAGDVSGDITVLPQEPPLLNYWPYFAIVPIAVALFILNQWLKAKRRIRSPRARP